jgi:hypothetical protein
MAQVKTKNPAARQVGERTPDTEVEPQVGTADDPSAAPSEPQPMPERVFATPDMFGEGDTVSELELPVLGVWVKVRLLAQEDVLHLGFIPDYAGFIEMATKAQELAAKEEAGKKLSAKDRKSFEANRINMEVEQLRYQHHLAHLAILHPDADLKAPEPCEDCTPADLAKLGQYVQHPKSLWTLAQARHLSSVDTDIVVAVALQAERASVLRPFSQDQPQPGSPAAAPTTE